jgi:hypothetical protein
MVHVARVLEGRGTCRGFVRKLEGRERFKDLEGDGRIIL